MARSQLFPVERSGSRRWLLLGVIALVFGSGTVQAVEPASKPCPSPENRQEVVYVRKLSPQPSGVWAGLEATFDVPEPVLLGTDDDGNSWRYHCLAEAGDAESVFFLDERVGWAAILDREYTEGSGAGAAILRTTNGGRTWTAGSVPPGNQWQQIHDVVFVDATHGWAVGEEAAEDGNCCSPVVLRSIDGGVTWTRLPHPPGTVMLDQVHFVDALHGWALDPDWRLGHTEDGGLTWTVTDLEKARRYRDMAFTDRRTGWIIGYGNDFSSVWKTTDAGRTWTETSRFDHGVGTLTALDRDTLIVAGNSPATIERSEDGGDTWTAQAVPADFTTMAAYDRRTMWAFGGQSPERDGCLYRTSDGGHTWIGYPLFNRRTCPPAG